jgi:hypothetical protein
MITVYYREREKSPGFLEKAIAACYRQIANSPQSIRDWRRWHAGVIPTNKGYEQLAIIREKEGNYAEALRLSEEAMNQGWGPKPGWQARIDRLTRRLAKARMRS